MTDSEPIHPDPEDFAAAEASAGPLSAENGSPAQARRHYEVAQAHKLVRHLMDIAERIRESGSAVRRDSKRIQRPGW